MRSRRVLLIGIAVLLLVFQTYVLLNHAAYWTDHPNRDIPLHFMWGLVVFLAVVDIFDWRVQDALLAVLVIAFVFEACEMSSERLTRPPDAYFDNFFTDGFTDNLVNVSGGLFGALLLCVVTPWPKTRSSLHRHFTLFLYAMIPMCIAGACIAWYSIPFADYFVIAWTFATLLTVTLACKPQFHSWVWSVLKSK